MLYKALEHITRLLEDDALAELDEELGRLPGLRGIHNELTRIREILFAFSNGDFSPDIGGDSGVFKYLAAHKEHMNHLFLQMQLVEQGNLTPQFSLTNQVAVAFNRMVCNLDSLFANMKNEEKASQEREFQLKYLADHDPLTGAVNRRAFMERAMIELRNNMAKKIPCGIIMIDIDFFKKFNDTYGHLAGDKALRHLVETISSTMRKDDFLGRYGGEEFVFFFSNADKKTAMGIAERLRKTLENTCIHLDAAEVAITASFGVALAEDVDAEKMAMGEFVEKLIGNADQALYCAKNTGRNRAVAFDKSGQAVKKS
jgi:diguanylate cyclase (GGDEF)-like protein